MYAQAHTQTQEAVLYTVKMISSAQQQHSSLPQTSGLSFWGPRTQGPHPSHFCHTGPKSGTIKLYQRSLDKAWISSWHWPGVHSPFFLLSYLPTMIFPLWGTESPTPTHPQPSAGKDLSAGPCTQDSRATMRSVLGALLRRSSPQVARHH